MIQLLNNLPPTPIFSPVVENWADDPLPCDLYYYSEVPTNSAASAQCASDWTCRSCFTVNHGKYENETCFGCNAVKLTLKKNSKKDETVTKAKEEEDDEEAEVEEEEWRCQRCDWDNPMTRRHCMRCMFAKKLQTPSLESPKDEEVAVIVVAATLCLAQQKVTAPPRKRMRGVRSGKKVRERRLAAIERSRRASATPPSA
eukprot:TRINITY_DN4413_c0_g1_i1.p1 TRINITY_DN4413_c0_g1~~TRINITY_DN4413_c0_g1_i1.p1  ORF type:complete len:200 (+),score=41.07 TRINITY_DN4413_c0_g1_i1:101-700(+)